MKNLLLIFTVVFAFSACQSDKSTATADPAANTAETAANKTKAATAKMVRDTTKRPVAKKSTSVHPNFSRSRARQKTQINASYPYDIPLKTKEGKETTTDAVLKNNGKPTVLLFWLSTCLPCAMEMKAIKSKYADWEKQSDFNFYAISTDFEKNFPRFQKKIDDGQWPWDTYNDVNREFRQIMPGGLNGLPQTFLLDSNGEIVYHKRKYQPGDEDVLFEKVKQLSNK